MEMEMEIQLLDQFTLSARASIHRDIKLEFHKPSSIPRFTNNLLPYHTIQHSTLLLLIC